MLQRTHAALRHVFSNNKFLAQCIQIVQIKSSLLNSEVTNGPPVVGYCIHNKHNIRLLHLNRSLLTYFFSDTGFWLTTHPYRHIFGYWQLQCRVTVFFVRWAQI